MGLPRQILSAVSKLSGAGGPEDVWIRPVTQDGSEALNHCVLFLKPEVLAVDAGVQVGAVLDLVRAALKKYAVEVGAIRVMNGPYLGQHCIMEAHYGVINRASRLGQDALSETTRKKLLAEFGAKPHRILGAHQFLEEFPDISAFALNAFTDTLGTKKIASGKYYVEINVGGEQIIVLNPFHPYQLQHFTERGRTIVVFECWTNTPWRALRQEMTGATDPAKAAPGSIRRTLLDKKAQLGLADVRTATNGVHLSAGPLEAMAEFCRFFSDHSKKSTLKIDETPFGSALARHGLNKAAITKLLKNPILQAGGKKDYAFNLTEEMNSDAAADLLAGTVMAA